MVKLPRDNKKTNFEDYTNDEVRVAIKWSISYLNRPDILRIKHIMIYRQWKQYEKKLKGLNEEPNYNHWIICYPFGI